MKEEVKEVYNVETEALLIEFKALQTVMEAFYSGDINVEKEERGSSRQHNVSENDLEKAKFLR